MQKMGKVAETAIPVAESAGNHVNVRAGIYRQRENGGAEQLKQMPEFSVACESKRRDGKGAKDGEGWALMVWDLRERLR